MNIRRLTLTALALAFAAVLGGAAAAQTWTPEQQELWKFEQQQWDMSMKKDDTWIVKMVHPNVSLWETGQPAPRNMASLAKWNRYNNTNSTVLEQELFPISIAITGNIAVVNYTYQTARENYKKDRETTTGRYMDVLVKDGGKWMFIAWAGGDDPKK